MSDLGREPRYQGGEVEDTVRLTQTAADTYRHCGPRWIKDRLTKHGRTTIPLAIGTAGHAGANADLTDKAAGGTGRSINDIRDIAVATYETETDESEMAASKSEVARGKDSVADAAIAYATKVSPSIHNVIANEKPIIARFGDSGIELAGKPDVITNAGVGDFKFGRPWDQQRADRSEQLTAYGMLARAHIGEYPKRVWIDSIGLVRQKWVPARLWSYRTSEDYAAYWQVLQAVRDGIEAGIFIPASPLDWRCSAAYCPHFFDCEFVSKRT
jgi:hypothetical protein